jgi:hypothetical protein
VSLSIPDAAEQGVDPRSYAAKLAIAASITEQVRLKLSGPPPAQPDFHASPIDRALIPYNDFILPALKTGWQCKAIAAALRALGFPFSEATTYLHLSKLYPNGVAKVRKPRKLKSK